MSISREKHGRIEGGLLDEDVLASSRSILQPGRGAAGTVKGMQQWFTPVAIASFVARVLGPDNPVIDTTAGAGSMLKGFDRSMRFGIEFDPDHTKEPSYQAIAGDVQRVLPMMRAAGLQFPRVAINPPFGLDWRDPKHASATINSTVLAYLWSTEILQRLGMGAMLSGTLRLKNEVMRRPESNAIFAIVDITENVWPEVDLPCSISFFLHPENRRADYPAEHYESSVEDLFDLAMDIKRDANRHSAAYVAEHTHYYSDGILQTFRAVRNEYERRAAHRAESKRKQKFDVELKGQTIKAAPAAYGQLLLAKAGTLRQIQLIDNQHVNYFATSTKTWRLIREAEESGHITVSPILKEKVEKIVENAKLLSTPLFPLKPQMRLGWITDLEKIRCTQTDPHRGFVEGSEYPIYTGYLVQTEKFERLKENKQGEVEPRQFVQERKVLGVRITPEPGVGVQSFNESKADIEYMMAHFDMPDPGSVVDLYPEEVAKIRSILDELERENGFGFKEFQKDHLSRLLTKRRGLLAHEQGLGKTLMLMACAEVSIRLGAENKVLFVCPQDLIPQWKREAKKFFGRELIHITSPEDAIRVARELENGGEGWYITHYECLSLTGRKFEPMPILHSGARGHLKNLADRLEGYRRAKKEHDELVEAKKVHCVEWHETTRKARLKRARELTPKAHSMCLTVDACPKCGNDTAEGWTGEVCRRDREHNGCGYVHRKLMKKPAYRYLTHAFRRGVTCVDELSEMRGDASLRSKALRALNRGPFKFGGTGTPVSNYINDAFWGLWWTLGNASPAFPYSYDGGKAKFESDFCVKEYLLGKKGTPKEGQRQNSRVLPMVTNVSQFWRLTQPGVSRCRKEQTGEPLVERIFKPMTVPMGRWQKQDHDLWLMHFARYFTEMNPDHNLVLMGLVERFEGMIGLGPKLEYAATMPTADVEGLKWEPETSKAAAKTMEDLRANASPWTPATLKVLEVALQHAKQGEKILIGSDLIAPGKWLAERLNEKGVKAVHLTEEKNGKTSTKAPKKRSREVTEFVEGEAQIMCAGIQSMKLGHNMDVASVVIVHGLPYSFMAMDQFLARVHRLTSKKPVTVYVVIPKGSLAETKWNLLKDKGGASDLAFDGELSDKKEEEINWNEILRELKKRGVRTDTDVVPEPDVEAQWEKIPYAICRPAADTIKQPKGEVFAPVVEIAPKRKEKEEKKTRFKSSLFDTPLQDVPTFVQDSLFG